MSTEVTLWITNAEGSSRSVRPDLILVGSPRNSNGRRETVFILDVTIVTDRFEDYNSAYKEKEVSTEPIS